MGLVRLKHHFFPEVIDSSFGDIIAYSHDISPEMLVESYSKGVFPWPQEGYPILWFSPMQRGVLDFADFHVPRSFERFQKTIAKQNLWQLKQNQNFQQVIEECSAQPRKGQDGTWITEEILEVYQEFFDLGYVRTFEVWEGEELVGGMYGVFINGRFSGESMFHKKTNASKWALYQAVQILKDEGLGWIDTQMVTPVIEAFGGKYISRDQYLARISE